ncbi:WD40-repeat-containing domain protein [Blastocladiella britannica]|nr:WD40-repeat-containing domain protein [Blastocladiella britannica]
MSLFPLPKFLRRQGGLARLTSELDPPHTAPGDNISAFLQARTVADHDTLMDISSHGARNLANLAAERLPMALDETPLTVNGYDKVFASHWVDDHHIVIGTKCNKLLLLSTRSNRVIDLPYASLFPPPLCARPSPVLRTDSAVSVEGGSSGALPLPPLPPNGSRATSSLACLGIHSIAVNPSRTRMAVGGAKPYEVVVYALPEMVPVALMTGHADLVFALKFVSDDVIVTGSRDTAVGIFNLSAEPIDTIATSYGILPVIAATSMRREHTAKVRDLQYQSGDGVLATLGGDATVRLWDVNQMRVVSKMRLAFPTENVCMGSDPVRGVLSVGSQSHVSLLDARAPVRTGRYGGDFSTSGYPERVPPASRALHHFTSVDEGWGVRSLAHNRHVIAVGGGMGRLSFYDTRGMAYLPVGAGGDQRYMDVGQLQTGEDAPVRGSSSASCMALYALSYNDDYTQLFTGGGPLQLGMRGAYCAVW